MANFELIVFDWDGTLLDSTGTIAASIQAAAKDLDIPVPSDERARHIIGLGLLDALRYAMPGLPESRYAEVADRYRHHYLSRDQDLLLFAGAAELVKDLANAGFALAVATGKSRRGLDRALETSGLGQYFQATRCADECHSKPHPQMLEELMAAFGVPSATTLMIGDTTHDLQMAKNAGAQGLGVTYGAHPRAALEAESPLFCADDVTQLGDWLRVNG
ncbi:MAG: phosphoglycolate phosphatase [Rugosibacter sp.]|jgi:phosphoglycolate phosphatase|nr:phosphoglycolate phosphatase [Rugosibacter sp.]